MKKLLLFAICLVLLVGLFLPTQSFAQDSTVTITANNPAGTYNSSEWQWIITKIGSEGDIPQFITVYWTDGSISTVNLNGDVTDHFVAHYRDTAPEDLTKYPSKATAVINADWLTGTGQFTLSDGPLTAPPPPVPELPPVALFALGLVGLAAFVFIRRKRSLLKTH